MQDTASMNIISAFVHEWALCADAKSVLHIKTSTFNLFPNLHKLNTQEVDATQNIPNNTHYDLILGDLPLGMNPVEWNDGTKTINARRN